VRTCARCGEERPIEDFPERVLGSGRRHGHCRACKAAYQREWYARNAARHKANVAEIRRARIRTNREIVQRAKAVPCSDCGRCYPPYVMDFDHRTDDKVGAISQMTSSAPTAVLLAEIAKCEVVCANCHRERTYGDPRSAWHTRPTPWSRDRDEEVPS
jgi:L-lysine 2,3-aminomutase